MFDQKYEREDLGFTFVVSPLGELVTDPGFKAGQWFVKHTDEVGIFIMPLEEELAYFSGNDPVWNRQVKAIFNATENVVLICKVGAIEREQSIITLLHRSAMCKSYYIESKDR